MEKFNNSTFVIFIFAISKFRIIGCSTLGRSKCRPLPKNSKLISLCANKGIWESTTMQKNTIIIIKETKKIIVKVKILNKGLCLKEDILLKKGFT